jgi:alpha-beta hydrolase superfamily lysophospholipase
MRRAVGIWAAMQRLVLWLSFLLAAVAASEDTASSCPSLVDFRGGGLTASIVRELALGSGSRSLAWLADEATFFHFEGHDGIPLQGYALNKSSETDISKPVLIYVAGWTETSLKYSPFLRTLHEVHKYPVYSFDLRGQGFSNTTFDDQGRVTHIDTFAEYVEDLAAFAKIVVGSGRRDVVYVGNSLAGLVGLAAQQKHSLFSRLCLAAPVIRPSATLNPLVRSALYAAHQLGLGKFLPVRLSQDISTLKLTHNADHLDAWQRLRSLAPAQLHVQGPSLSWLSEVTEAGAAVLAAARHMRRPLLLFVAEDDVFVDNASIFRFAEEHGGSTKLVKIEASWHELYLEDEGVLSKLLPELLSFLQHQ